MCTPTSTEAPTAMYIAIIEPRSEDSESGDNEDTSPRENHTDVEQLIVDPAESDGIIANELGM